MSREGRVTPRRGCCAAGRRPRGARPRAAPPRWDASVRCWLSSSWNCWCCHWRTFANEQMNLPDLRESPLKGVRLKLLTRVNSSSACRRPSSTAGSSDFSPDPPAVPGYPGHAHSPHLCLMPPAPSCSLSVTTCCLYCCRVKQVTYTRVLEAI